MKKTLILLLVTALAPHAFAASRNVPSQYSTIQAAVNAAVSGDVINIANGTYTGQIDIPGGKSNIRLIGASQTGVILQSGQNQTTLTVSGNDITISTLSVINTYLNGSTTSHAARVNGKRIQFNRCYINGWQDTLAIWNNALAYFSFCEIRGCVDYIYSGGTAYFQSCNVRQCRTTGGVDTAPSTPQEVKYGFVFNQCTMNRGSGIPNNSSTLMRPWYPYGSTTYINCTMDAHITAAGWSPWDGRESTCRAAEYGSKTPSGASINLSSRSSWVKRLTAAEAATYSRNNVLGGWVPPL